MIPNSKVTDHLDGLSPHTAGKNIRSTEFDMPAEMQGMSYASGLAKLSPIAGLWSTAIPALIYAMLGTCR
jgi:hypothetical protein